MKEELIPVAYVISNIVAVIMLACSWKYPKWSRLLYFFLFGWASIVNGLAALNNPDFYLYYGQTAVLDSYRNFISGYFSEHITILVFIIAVCQLAIAVSMWLRGWMYKIGCIAAIVFLLAIMPLGTGSAFPCTLIMAAGLLLLLRKKEIDFLWEEFRKRKISEESAEVL